jgi:predicted amidohydrolase YtcJ
VIALAGGTVRTMDPQCPLAGALLIEGDRIAAVLGDASEIPAAAERVDLAGGCALPGFTDSHVHFPSWSQERGAVDLTGVESVEEAIARVRAAADRAGEGWLRGKGWNDRLWPAEPTSAALDEAFGDPPIALWSHDHHSLWASSAALGQASGSLAVAGGVVEDSGILREESAWQFYDAHGRPGFEETLRMMDAGIREVHGRGVVAVHDKDGGRSAPELFAALREVCGPPLRVRQSVPAERMRDGVGQYVKCFLDGTLGSGTALMLDGRGMHIMQAEEFREVIIEAASLGLPCSVHAIGDAANREALDAYEVTQEHWRPRGLRQRMEHAQCLHADDLPRFASLGITASVQFQFAVSDEHVAEREWPGLLDGAYAWRSLLDSGAHLVNGSDAPIEALDPLAGMRAGVLRSWRPHEAVTPEDALRAHTTAPAWLAGEEDERGMLRAGMLADVAVLDRDPVEDLAGADVVATMLGGEWVHGPFGTPQR